MADHAVKFRRKAEVAAEARKRELEATVAARLAELVAQREAAWRQAQAAHRCPE